jgi:Lectin C-type domain
VPDEATQVFMRQLAADLPLWLGATDAKINGVWEWINNERLTFKAWASGQPDGADREDYLMMIDGQWHDAFEGEPRAAGFVCEWKRKCKGGT